LLSNGKDRKGVRNMKFQGAVVKEQGVTFAIVVVKKSIVDSQSKSEEFMHRMTYYFPGMPIVLMAQDHRGVPKYRGRNDIVNFLANIDYHRIPWKEYTA
jgi:hypothetical protein